MYTLLHWTNSFFHIAGIVIALISFYFRMLARKHLGKSFSLKAEAKKLITHGMYSKIKNPIYFFSLLSFIGLFISLEKPWMFLALLPFIYMEIVRASKERKVLYEKFGEEYNIYRKKTRF
ncbi:MAG: isoprenylcysteine carboxylmethyltransferase family protein [bacterium]